MYEKDRIVNASLALCYLASALVVVAVYREQLAGLCGDVERWWSRRVASKPQSIRAWPGKLWRDVNEAVDDAG